MKNIDTLFNNIENIGKMEDIKSGETVVARMTIPLANPIKDKAETTTFSINLMETTETIHKALEIGKQSTVIVACELSRLDGDNDLIKAGFASVADYGYHVFGLAKSTVNAYVDVATLFYNAETYIADNVFPKSFTIGHFIELRAYANKYGMDVIHGLVTGENAVIHEGLSTMKLRAAMKAWETKQLESLKPDGIEDKESTSQPKEHSGETSATSTTSRDIDRDEYVPESQIAVTKALESMKIVSQFFMDYKINCPELEKVEDILLTFIKNTVEEGKKLSKKK